MKCPSKLSKRLSIGQIAAEMSSGRNINDSKRAYIFVRISRYRSAYRVMIISIASARDKLLVFTSRTSFPVQLR